MRSMAFAGRKPTMRCLGLGIFLCALSLACYCREGSGQANANNQNNQSDQAAEQKVSELAQQNADQVGASAIQLKSILLQDPGIMVELKRWVAKDATDHGQIVSENDLTDRAIFDRLETDVVFRSVATRLVQQYGFLLPEVNPDSEMGKQEALLMQKRVDLIAQQAQLELNDRHPQRVTSQGAPDCPQNAPVVSAAMCTDKSKSAQPSTLPPQNIEPRQAMPVMSPSIPGGTIPQQDSDGSLERAQYLLSPNSSSGDLSMLGLIPASSPARQSYGASGLSFDGLNGNQSGSLGLGNPDDNDRLFSSGLGSLSEQSLFGQDPRSAMQSLSSGRGEGFSSSLQNQLYTITPELVAPPEPTLVRAASPYRDIPSLYDMYLQAVPQPAVPHRFGLEIFENGLRDSQAIPMDLPVGPDYVVGPGDGLAVDLWGGVSQRFYSTVDREGRITLPEVGPLLVSGKSLADVQGNLQQVLRTQFRNVSVDVSLSRLRTIRVYEVGDIAKPGAYDISSLSTPLNALFAAGGPTPSGSMRIVKHYRGNQLIEEVDLYDLLLHGVKNGMARLENGDTVLVPPLGAQVTVEGMVRRPAIYELKDETTLSSVLELAGGMLPAATLRHIEVQRLVAHDKQTMLSLDIPESDGNAEVTQKLDAFQVQDGDRIRIYPIAPYNQNAVYLEGHVLRPGRYSYSANMRVGDLIASYKELLPEPAMKYAEIIRLTAPDFHPTVQSFDLGAAMENPSASPALQPMDTVRIFSRFDFENPPTVSVWGDVRTPGTYQTSGQIHLADAVHLAGGLSPDAQTQDAQVFRYLPDGEFKIFSVNLSEALSGDPTENIELQTRDRLLIHGNPQAVQPATVYVEGEVSRPGRYPLTTNMTVADLIKVGGGLNPSADTKTAELTSYAFTDAKPGQSQLTAEHKDIAITAAMEGNGSANLSLHNGDVVTIRQLAGWNDLGSSITVRGEVLHPGTYGIRPGERLSSVLQRAGGLLPDAYAYGAVLQRDQVRDLESKQQDELILRVKNQENSIEALPDKQKEPAMQQYESTITQLSANPPLGRVTIRISARAKDWKNTTADIDVRAGDTLTIPKKPSYVMVTGQVFNSTAVSYRPGRSAKWYLEQSGGPTTLANKKAIFVVRADGSVIGEKQGLWGGEALGSALQPGDTVVVPEKAIGGGTNWQNLFTSAQVATSVVSTVFIALHY